MKNTLTKAMLVDAICERTGKPRMETRKVVEQLLEVMKNAIRRDYSLLLSGFGKFECYEKSARKGRNPHTDETITLDSRKVVVFRISRKLRVDLNPAEESDSV